MTGMKKLTPAPKLILIENKRPWTIPLTDLLDLFSIFVANKNYNRVDMNTVEPFDGMRSDVKQTMTILRSNVNAKHSFS